MPYVSINLAGPAPSEAQCEEVIADITEILVTKLGKPRELVMVTINEIPPTQIGVGGQSVAQMRRKATR